MQKKSFDEKLSLEIISILYLPLENIEKINMLVNKFLSLDKDYLVSVCGKEFEKKFNLPFFPTIELHVLSKAIKECKNITGVEFKNFSFSLSLNAFSDVLTEIPHLKKLKFINCNIFEEELCDLLKATNNTCLEELDLSGTSLIFYEKNNFFSTKGIESYFLINILSGIIDKEKSFKAIESLRFFINNRYAKKLYLNNCDLNHEHALYLCSLFREYNSLEKFSAKWNEFGQQGYDRFLKIVLENNNFYEFDVRDKNDTSSDILVEIQNIIKENIRKKRLWEYNVTTTINVELEENLGKICLEYLGVDLVESVKPYSIAKEMCKKEKYNLLEFEKNKRSAILFAANEICLKKNKSLPGNLDSSKKVYSLNAKKAKQSI